MVASIFLFGSIVAHATERDYGRSPVDFRNADPIVFSERGIEFFIFPDGQFDFNTRPSTGDMYYKQGKRTSAVNKNYGKNSQNRNYGIKVEHDFNGRVRRVGNVMINYDANDRVKRVGSVYITYNRYGLDRVGDLQIMYNRRGQIVDLVGAVKGGRAYQYSQNNYDEDDCDDGYAHNTNNQDDTYYRTNDSKPKIKRSLDIRVNN